MLDRADPSYFYLKTACNAASHFDRKSDPVPNLSAFANVDQELILIHQERNLLLSMCKYTSDRSNDIFRYLYLKPDFVLKNIPDGGNDRQRILNIYLADQDTLFTYSDECYWRRQVSGEIARARRALSYNAEERKQLLDRLPVWTMTLLTDERVIPASDKNLHIILMNRIFEKAGKSPGFVKWVERNIHRAVPTDDERLAICNTSGLTDQGVARLRRIVRYVIPDSLCQIYLPDSEAYQQAEQNLTLFQELLPEYRNQVTPQFCRAFVNFVLTDYMTEYDLATNPRYHPDYVPEEVKRRNLYLFYQYKWRLNVLEQLQAGFSQKPISVLKSAKGAPFVFALTLEKISNVDSDIANAIRQYFMDIGQSLREDHHHYLEQRVHWAVRERSVAQSMQPVFLLYMAICCKQNLISNHGIAVSDKSSVRWYIGPKRDHPKQRYAQLMLLEKLYKILAIAKEEQYRNWTQFFAWTGKYIMSPAETVFWRNQLDKDDYNQLPAIGFQLCCLDYLRNCLSAHFEDLSYTAGSRLHLGGYHDFWTKNHDLIEKRTKLLAKEHPKLVREYRKVWSSLRDNFVGGIQWLKDQLAEQILIDLQEFQMEAEYNPAELKRLVLETELRLCVCFEARKALIELCERTYDLNHGLFKDFL